MGGKLEIREVSQIRKLLTRYIMSIVDPGNNQQWLLKALEEELMGNFIMGWNKLITSEPTDQP